jgi:hypothetical protein
MTSLLDEFGATLVKKNVPIVEFCESDEYCGKKLYPRQRTLLKLIWLEELDGYEEDVLSEWIKSSEEGGEVRIAPLVRERMDLLREQGAPHFRLTQLVGGRRSSKGHLTGACIAKKIHNLVQIDDVGTHYGIDKDKDIYVSILASAMQEAKDNQYSDAVNWVLDCKPLQERGLINKILSERFSIYTPHDKARLQQLLSHGIKPDKDLAKIKVAPFSSNARTVRGFASIILVFDEMAHLIGGESVMSDKELWDAATPGLDQFREDAMIFANSSPATKIGMFYQLYQRALELDGGRPVYPNQFMMQYPSWELYKDWERDYRWKNAIVVDPKYEPNGSMALEERADPETFKVERRAQFAEVVDAFLNPEMVNRMFDPEWNMEVLGRELTPQLGAKSFVAAAYKGHGDPSSTTANFGIAIGHIEYITDVERGLEVPHVVFDMIDAFYPEDFEEHTIDWLQVLPSVVSLINNFRPYEFTFDQFDSTAPIQLLNKELANQGLTATRVYEKTATPKVNRRRADNFKAALNLGQVHAPHPYTRPQNASSRPAYNSIELGREELKFLQDRNGKIDKPDIGPIRTKDIADCIMEVVDALIGEFISSLSGVGDAGLEAGAHHGYRIGKRASTDDFDNFYEAYQNSGYLNPARGQHKRDRSRRGRY